MARTRSGRREWPYKAWEGWTQSRGYLADRLGEDTVRAFETIRRKVEDLRTQARTVSTGTSKERQPTMGRLTDVNDVLLVIEKAVYSLMDDLSGLP